MSMLSGITVLVMQIFRLRASVWGRFDTILGNRSCVIVCQSEAVRTYLS